MIHLEPFFTVLVAPFWVLNDDKDNFHTHPTFTSNPHQAMSYSLRSVAETTALKLAGEVMTVTVTIQPAALSHPPTRKEAHP